MHVQIAALWVPAELWVSPAGVLEVWQLFEGRQENPEGV